MGDDGLGQALEQPAGLGMGVVDLIKAAETLKQSGAMPAVSALYATWIQHNRADPLLYAVLFNYSVVLTDLGDLERAKLCLEQAIQLKDDFMPARINLGRVHERLGAIDAAIGCWSAVADGLAVVSGSGVQHKITALNQMARTLEALGRDEAAESVLRQSLDIDPAQREVVQHLVAARQRGCAWPIIQPTERVSREVLMKGQSPLSAAAFSDDPLLQLAIAHHYNETDVGLPPWRFESWPAAEAASGEGRLRIGYLSSDLREHAVGHLMAEVFGLHDRGKVEVVAYYCGIPARDPMHLAFQAAADRWVDVSQMDDDSAARRIAADGIHILVDVNGYTREGRTKLIARRPAPVIVNWLGYPGTVASPYHHYIVADDFIIPGDHERYYSERVLRLPCYQPNNRNRVVAERRPTRTEAGLPESGTVFCCFNGSHKITRFTFARWLEILAAVPGSVLWLLTGSAEANARLQGVAAAAGLPPDRIVFAPKVANPDHLARYPLADLFLDCTPYGAHTTASDALFMGVPVLTWPGRCFASRVCGSLVSAAGLPDLAVSSSAAYVETAVRLGRDPAALTALKARLAASRETCVLFDMPLLVRSLEALYQEMWADRMAGRLPEPDLANLDAYLDTGIAVDHEAEEVQGRADYLPWWQARLAARSRLRRIPPDNRMVAP